MADEGDPNAVYTVPPAEVKPGDSAYAALQAYWVKEGRPGTIERLRYSWQYRVIFPDTSGLPVFLLVATGLPTDIMADGAPQGYPRVMAVDQSSLPGRGR